MKPDHTKTLSQSHQTESPSPKSPIRESGYELLRIVSMLMIVSFHTFRYIDTSGFNHWQMLAFHGVRWYGLFGVNCFLMISAWFLVGRQPQPQKLIPLVSQTAFYCIILFVCHIVYNILQGTFHPATDIGEVELTALLSPFWANRYWFITAYVFLYLLIPYYNRLIQMLSAQTFRKGILCGSLFVFLYLTLPQTFENTTVIGDILWVSYVYFLTAYLKLHREDNAIKRHAGVFLLLTYITFVLSKQALTYLVHNEYLKNILSHTLGNSMRYSFVMLLLALELFYLFQRFHFKSRLVNTIASCTFGIYLFHENKIFHICELLARKLYRPFITHIPSPALFMLTLVLLQFIAGCLVDLLRQSLFAHVQSLKKHRHPSAS